MSKLRIELSLGPKTASMLFKVNHKYSKKNRLGQPGVVPFKKGGLSFEFGSKRE